MKKKDLLALELGHLSADAVSGGDTLLRQLIPFMTKDYNITVLIPNIAANHWKKIKKTNSIKLLELSPDPLVLHDNFSYFISYIYRMTKASDTLKGFQTDLILSTNNIITDILPAFLFKMNHPSIKWIVRIHHLSPLPHRRAGNLFSNTAAYILQQLSLDMIKRKADAVIALNEPLNQTLLKMNFDTRKVKTIGAGINLKKIKSHKVKKYYDYDAVFLGRLHFAKGVFDLPEIWKRVIEKYSRAKLAVIGEARTQTKEKFKSLIKEKKLEKNIDILGFVSETKLYDILKSSKLFLMTDLEAGFSLATAEAMACGLPIVAYQNPIFGSVFKKGFVTVPLKNTTEFSRQISRYLKDNKSRKKLAIQAQSQAEEFDINKIGNKFRNLLRQNYS